jgi:phage repressor protein C with HTH and peptisase S24 domain
MTTPEFYRYPRYVAGVHTSDEMEPTFRRGDHIAVDASVNEIESDGIYAIGFSKHVGFVAFARAQRRKDGIALNYDNKLYTADFVPNDKIGDLVVFGRAIMIGREL